MHARVSPQARGKVERQRSSQVHNDVGGEVKEFKRSTDRCKGKKIGTQDDFL